MSITVTMSRRPTRSSNGNDAKIFLIAACALGGIVCTHAASADDEAAARSERWAELQRAIFPGRTISEGAGVIQLDAPPRALDAALVPFTIALRERQADQVRIPGDRQQPGAACRALHIRRRRRPTHPQGTHARQHVHQCARGCGRFRGQTLCGARFVKASGGCSAPAGSNDEESTRNLGQMKLKLLSEFAAGKPVQAQLMIRHPNFNGMQMDQLTRLYAPAHFIRTINITYDDQPVLRIESDIALSTDPVITFGFKPSRPGAVEGRGH